ncbi:hypothetical protein N656DRAFT_802372 [Canariomyces notabilis]|uniref:Uncharacterized protein n=1 Tax=Canariomyces notabilis TaxID=2074819 RepID=A0AAN6QCT8_9PEZI|nr:hypothetical protein N656DRAFT_802372 [Canariomyces arenarius]
MCLWVTVNFYCQVCYARFWQSITIPVRCEDHRAANREWGVLGHRRQPDWKIVSDYLRACINCDPKGDKYPHPLDFGEPEPEPELGQGQGQGQGEGQGTERTSVYVSGCRKTGSWRVPISTYTTFVR